MLCCASTPLRNPHSNHHPTCQQPSNLTYGDEGIGPDASVRVGGGHEVAVGLEGGFEGGVQALAPSLEGAAHYVAALADLDQEAILVLGHVNHDPLVRCVINATWETFFWPALYVKIRSLT